MAKRGSVPSDFASDQPPPEAKKPKDYYVAAELNVGSFTLMHDNEEIRSDAQRAVTFVNLHPERFRAEYGETGVIGEVFFALGLLELPEKPKRVVGPLSVACPKCEMPAGRRCVSKAGNEFEPKSTHKDRRQAAAKLSEGES